MIYEVNFKDMEITAMVALLTFHHPLIYYKTISVWLLNEVKITIN
jgi:hypothetical protein